jgi:hypothetical protein
LIKTGLKSDHEHGSITAGHHPETRAIARGEKTPARMPARRRQGCLRSSK